jgi:hypothetical protein
VNTNIPQSYDTRGLRIGVIAVLAVAVLAGAAFWFGTGLRADTSQSVARSPLGSSLTAVRASRVDDYYGRLLSSSAAVAAAALAKSRLDDYYGRLNNSAAAAASSGQAARASNPSEDYYFRWNRSGATDRLASQPEGLLEDYYFRMNR